MEIISKENLKNLIARGKRNGHLTFAEVNDAINDDLNSLDQIEDIVVNFKELGIKLIDEQRLIHKEEPINSEIVTITQFINEKIIEEVNKNPSKLYNLSPRQFEELVAELFYREGFDVELTPETRDGGVDIIAIKNNKIGSHLYIAECKRFNPKRPVGINYLRSLYGVVEEKRATMGILATTSYFSKESRELCHNLKWRLGLKDYNDILKWIKQHC